MGSILTRGGIIFYFKFCNPNLHNTARSDIIRFKTRNPNEISGSLNSLFFVRS